MTVYLNNTLVPSPDMDGTKLIHPKTWASGAGRSASGNYTGRVQYFKYTLTLKWSWITSAQYKTIKQICESNDFITVKVVEENGTTTFTAYSGDVDYAKEGYAGKDKMYNGVTVTLVEK